MGFISTSARPPALDVLREIVQGNICRGPHAFGFAWIDSIGRMRTYKQAGNLSKKLDFLNLLTDARMFIGHMRHATHGLPSDNITNHPHPVDGGWFVHNGVVHNYDAITAQGDVWPNSECDSEVFGLLAENSTEATHVDRLSDAVTQTTGGAVVLGMWKHPRQIVAIRRGNPLHLAQGREGIYMASLTGGLPGQPQSAKDDSVIHFVAQKGKMPSVKTYTLREKAVRV